MNTKTMGSGASVHSSDEEIRDDSDADVNSGIPDTDEQDKVQNTNNLCHKIRSENASNDGKNRELVAGKVDDDVKEKRRTPKMVKDQSYEGPECIIAIKDNTRNLRQKELEFEISAIPHNEILRQREDKRIKEEVERLKSQQQEADERRASKERVLLLMKRLDVVFKELLKHNTDEVVISQETIDDLSNLVRKFHVKNKLEEPLSVPEKKHLILEKNLQKRKRRIEQLQAEYVEATPKRLQQANPDIAELCSSASARSLANQLSQLYGEERKRTFEEARLRAAPNISDKQIATCLRNLFMFHFKRCQDLVVGQSEAILRFLTLSDEQPTHCESSIAKERTYEDVVNEVSCQLLIKELQKNVSKWSIGRVKKNARKDIYKDSTFDVITVSLRAPPYRPPLSLYLDRCAEICWFSQLLIPTLSAEYSRKADKRQVYTSDGDVGPSVREVEWPALVQPSTGVLVNNVAMFDNESVSRSTIED